MIQVGVKTYEELTKDELYAVLKLRSDVFIYEQESICEDIDGQDPSALHFLAKDSDTIVGTLRLLPHPEERTLELGRVVTAKDSRGKGIAREMIELALVTAGKSFGGWTMKTAAQKHLQGFYEQFGLSVAGEIFTYPKDHIPHVPMQMEIVG